MQDGISNEVNQDQSFYYNTAVAKQNWLDHGYGGYNTIDQFQSGENNYAYAEQGYDYWTETRGNSINQNQTGDQHMQNHIK